MYYVMIFYPSPICTLHGMINDLIFYKALYIAYQSFKFTTDDEDITRALNRTGECPDDAPDGDCLVS